MEGTLAEIRLFAGNFNPRSWALCNGQLLSIASYTAVFALLGTTYGGNGTTTFALPDFRGRSGFGAHFSSGPGLPNIDLGELAGTESITLVSTQLPVHNHSLNGVASLTQGANAEREATNANPSTRYPGIVSGGNAYSTSSDSNMAAIINNITLSPAGSNQPFSIRPPYLGLNFIICLEGIFPSRN
ncbi:MAG: tail fiber protein [Chitinophagaceae bacterium]|nr:tail fiber protein [Chitinophagaceae bacterium]